MTEGPTPGAPGSITGTPSRSRSRRLAVGIGASAVVLIAVIAALADGGAHSNHPRVAAPNTTVPSTSTVPPATTTTASTTTTTIASGPHPTVPPGITPLSQLVPSDVHPSTDCSRDAAPPKLIGLAVALICSPRNLPGGQIFAFQFDSAADFATSLVALNKFKGFAASTAGTACPPGAAPQDSIGWHNPSYPPLVGQILECLTVGTNSSQPDYIWTYPAQDAIIDAQAAADSSFADLDTWWTKDAPPPVPPPTSVPSPGTTP